MVHGFDEVAQAGEQAQRITIAFLALAWLFISLRVWTRTWIIASFGWDDATMIIAGVSIIRTKHKSDRVNTLIDGLYGIHGRAAFHPSKRR